MQLKQIAGRSALAVAAALALAAAPAAQAQADLPANDFAIHVSGSGEVTRIGPLRQPARSDLPAAKRAFGPAVHVERDDESCPAYWPAIGLRILFVDLGGGNPCTREGSAQTATLSGRRWHTARGLQVGASIDKLRDLYPNARRLFGQQALIRRKTPIGLLIPLGATLRDGSVTALQSYLGGAGE